MQKWTGHPEYSFHLTEEGQETLPKGYKRLLGLTIAELASLTAEEAKTRTGNELLESVFKYLSGQVC